MPWAGFEPIRQPQGLISRRFCWRKAEVVALFHSGANLDGVGSRRKRDRIPWTIEQALTKSSSGPGSRRAADLERAAEGGVAVRNLVDTAKIVLEANERVLYGIFGQIGSSGYFPPRCFLNEFLMRGHDPCDQDRRMASWPPFSVTAEEYRELKAWWEAGHAGALEDDLGVASWDDWVQQILER